MDLLSGGLDQLLDLGGGPPAQAQPPNPMQTQMNQNPMGGGLLDLMGGGPPAPQAAAPTGLDALGNMGLFGSAAPPTVKSNKVKDLIVGRVCILNIFIGNVAGFNKCNGIRNNG